MPPANPGRSRARKDLRDGVDQLVGVEWLLKKIIRAGTGGEGGTVLQRGDGERRYVFQPWNRFQVGEQRMAIHVRNDPVHDDHVRFNGLRSRDRVSAARRDLDVVATVLEGLLAESKQIDLVVDHQDPRHLNDLHFPGVSALPWGTPAKNGSRARR